jgi:hypothetical protein
MFIIHLTDQILRWTRSMKTLRHLAICILTILLIDGNQIGITSSLCAQGTEKTCESEVEIVEERLGTQTFISQIKREIPIQKHSKNSHHYPRLAPVSPFSPSVNMHIPRMIAYCCFLL